MNRIEQFRPADHSTALDHIHNPEIHLSYQVVDAIVREYQSGELGSMSDFLRDNVPNLLSHLQHILAVEPELASGFEHVKTKKLWEVVGYILGQYLVYAPDETIQSRVQDLVVQLSSIVNQQGESLIDQALLTMIAQLHVHSRRDWMERVAPDQKDRLAMVDARAEATVQRCLESYTTEAPKLLRAWVDSAGHSTRLLHTMRRLEAAHSGAITTLIRDYGVANYQRYPEAVLLKQVEQPAGEATAYGLVIAARADHNGSLNDDHGALEHLSQQLQQQCDLYIVEFGSFRELEERFNHVGQHRPADQRQAKFGLIMAHGNSESMAGGRARDGADAFVSTHEVSEVLKAQRDRHFTPDATWILSSCETGKRGGIAQATAKDLSIRTIAPDFSSSLQDIRVKILPGQRFDFEVLYHGKTLWNHVNHFSAGQA